MNCLKSHGGKMGIDLIGLMIVGGLFVAVFAVFISMLIFALYYSVFKRARMYCRLRKELKRVLQHDTVLEGSWEEEPAAQRMCAQEVCEEPHEDYDDDEILTMKSATALLKSLGWLIEIEGRGDHLATYYLPEREVQILYNDEINRGFPQFDYGFLIVTGLLAAACQIIDPSNSETLPDLTLNFEAKGLEIFEERVRAQRLKQALDEALKWAMKAVNLHKVLHTRYGTPPWERDEAIGRRTALLHLGALALLGDVETLLSYRKSFAQGNRLGFEEHIEEIHLERAVVLAEESAKATHLSYDLLERVAEKLSLKVVSYQHFRARDSELCNKYRDYHRKCVEEMKQELRQKGCIVCDEGGMFEAEN